MEIPQKFLPRSSGKSLQRLRIPYTVVLTTETYAMFMMFNRMLKLIIGFNPFCANAVISKLSSSLL